MVDADFDQHDIAIAEARQVVLVDIEIVQPLVEQRSAVLLEVTLQEAQWGWVTQLAEGVL